MTDTVVVLTSGTSWTVPAGCTTAKIECIGAGGTGKRGTNDIGTGVITIV
jgi:hypothetical protein